MMNNKNKGFTLLELLIAVGFVSVASVSTYNIASFANDVMIIRNETKNLSEFIKDIENTTNTNAFNDEAIQTFREYKSNLELSSITTKSGKLLLNYSNVKTRVCVDFVSKMISANKNITALINGKEITKNDLNEISNSCFNNQNELSIVVNKSSGYTIETITASVNVKLPNTNNDDFIVPEAQIPLSIPQVASFVPPTTTPIVYGLTGVSPVYPVVPPSGGAIAVTPGTSPGTAISPPKWTPPAFTPAPPATAAPVDDIDQNPLPPVPPPPPATGVQIVQGGTLNICKKYLNGSITVGSFTWLGNSMYANAKLYTIDEYYAKYKTFGTFNNGLKTFYDAGLNSILNPDPRPLHNPPEAQQTMFQ